MKLSLQRFSRELTSKSIDYEKVKVTIDSMLEQVEALSKIAISFTSFAKLPTVVFHELDVLALLKKTIQLYDDAQRIDLKQETDEVLIRSDAKILQGVVSNLLLNAIQAKRDEAELIIEILVTRVEGFCKIEIRDNGKGIDPAMREKIFMPHFTTKQSGSGLGLAIAKQSIELLLGKIEFETAPNEGTTFALYLPLALKSV